MDKCCGGKCFHGKDTVCRNETQTVVLSQGTGGK